MLGYVVSTTADIAADEQLEAREAWSEELVPELGRSLRFPDGWLKIDGIRYGVSSVATGGQDD